MPDIIFTLTTQHLTRLVDATCAVDGYVAGPETRQQFTKRMWAQRMKDLVRQYENEQAIRAVAPATEIGVT